MSWPGRSSQSYEIRGRTGRALRWQSVRADLLAGIDEFLDVEERHRSATSSVPIAVELRFGLGETPPVVLTLPSGRDLAFRGVADRIDRATSGEIFVSDYKTGRGDRYTALDRDPFGAGTTLQLGSVRRSRRPAARRARHVEPLLDGGTRGAFRRYGYRWDHALRERFVDVLQTIVDGIDHGAFPAVPGEWSNFFSTHDNCRYCEFDVICPADRGEHAEVKVDAPEIRGRRRLAPSPDGGPA